MMNALDALGFRREAARICVGADELVAYHERSAPRATSRVDIDGVVYKSTRRELQRSWIRQPRSRAGPSRTSTRAGQ